MVDVPPRQWGDNPNATEGSRSASEYSKPPSKNVGENPSESGEADLLYSVRFLRNESWSSEGPEMLLLCDVDVDW